jgi:hypothetical protein
LGGVGTGTRAFFNANPNSSTNGFNLYIGLNNNNDIGVSQLVSSSNVIRCATNAVYRDPAAWYHVVVVIDTTQATNSNGVIIYVNGVIQTLTFNAYTQNADLYVNSAISHQLGRSTTASGGSGAYYDGEMAEVNFVDGQALAPTAFGAYSTYNQWLPIKYAGTYGTNGFYLPFSATSATSYAGSFNGSTQYITAPSNAAFDLVANDFTIECWIYSTVAGSIQYFAGKSSVAGVSNSIIFFKEAANTLSCFVQFPSSSTITITSSATIPLNTWTHVAAVRNGATLRQYINGVQDGSNGGLSTTALATSTEVFAVGATGSFATGRWNGYISNFRLVNGTCVYPSGTTFIPPTTALTAITNTSLLTLQNATIVDNSTNAFTITNNGTVVTSVQSPFLNPTVLTADSSGNANNWTPNNISLTAGSTYDSLTDVPTLTSATVANYCVLNPLDKGAGMGVTDGNLTATVSSAGIVLSTIGVSTGKWYWEMTRNGSADNVIGIANASVSRTAYLGSDANGWGYIGSNGNKINAATSAAYGAAYASGVVVGVALDMTAGTLTFYRNNVSQGTAYSSLTGTLFAAFGTSNAGDSAFANFGQQPFVYTAPSGFLPLNTFNI